MTFATLLPSIERPRFHGVRQILRFNWTQYASGCAVILISLLALETMSLPHWIDKTLLIGSMIAGFWLTSSLVASLWIYDLSGLCRWDWIPVQLKDEPHVWINLHAGLDESTLSLRTLFPKSPGKTLDFFCADEMTEPSIARARHHGATLPSEAADYRHLPLGDESVDVVFLLFAAHELRRAESRAALFREVHRILRPEGQFLLAEHLRDLANFVAFGPGFLHFHSRRQWLKAARATGLRVDSEHKFTPFVSIFTLRRPL